MARLKTCTTAAPQVFSKARSTCYQQGHIGVGVAQIVQHDARFLPISPGAVKTFGHPTDVPVALRVAALGRGPDSGMGTGENANLFNCRLTTFIHVDHHSWDDQPISRTPCTHPQALLGVEIRAPLRLILRWTRLVFALVSKSGYTRWLCPNWVELINPLSRKNVAAN